MLHVMLPDSGQQIAFSFRKYQEYENYYQRIPDLTRRSVLRNL